MSLNEIMNKVGRKDKNLANFIGGILGEFFNEISMSNTGKIDLDQLIKFLKSEFVGRSDFNMIPGKSGGSCHEICLSMAFNKWNSQLGFKGIIDKVVDYWLHCFKINKGTVILTSAWDEKSFKERFKSKIDAYSIHSEKTVCIILVTSKGLSLQYLR